MQILDGFSFRGYQRGATPTDGCVGVLKSIRGEEVVLALTDPRVRAAPSAADSQGVSSSTPSAVSAASQALSAAAVAAAKADLDIEFVLSSSSSAWGSSFSSVEAMDEADTSKVVPAAPTLPPQRPAHGATFALTDAVKNAPELQAMLRRAYGPDAATLWWVLLGYSASGDRLFFCPHHTPLASVQSATAAVAAPIWSAPAGAAGNDTLFVSPAHTAQEALLRDVTNAVLHRPGGSGSSDVVAQSDMASHHFIRVPVGCVRSPSTPDTAESALTWIWSPPLDTSVLGPQFGVHGRLENASNSTVDPVASQDSTSSLREASTYVLSKTDRTPVQFLGVALGVPWVIDAEGRQRECTHTPPSTLGTASDDAPTFLDLADPLPGCYQADTLVRELGLRGSQTATPVPAAVAEQLAVVGTATSESRTPLAAQLPGDTTTPPPRVAAAAAPPPPPPPRPTSLPYFVKGRKIVVAGPYGVPLECDVSAAALTKKFGVAHADRLRLREASRLRDTLSTSEWEELDLARHVREEDGDGSTAGVLYVTVMGVAMGAPVVLFDDERKAVMLRSVHGVDGMRSRFIKVSGTELPAPALAIEPEVSSAARASGLPLSQGEIQPPSPPPPPARRGAYDEFRSSTSSSDADDDAEDVAAVQPPPVSQAPVTDDAAARAEVSPSATPSQLPVRASEANTHSSDADDDEDDSKKEFAAPEADQPTEPPQARDPSLAPTDLASRSEAPHYDDTPAEVPMPQSESSARAESLPQRDEKKAEEQDRDETEPTDKDSAGAHERVEDAKPVAVAHSSMSAARDASASPGIVLPTTSADRGYGLAHPEAAPLPNMVAPPSEPYEADVSVATSSGASAHTFTDFLKAYALYQLESAARTTGSHLDRPFTIQELQQFYQAEPLKRVMAAMEAQRRCQWLWGREGRFPSIPAALSAWRELCVDEVAEYLLAKEAVLQAMVAH